MIDRKVMRSLLENMEQAAEKTLQQDSRFTQALIALKAEIDDDPAVQTMVGRLQAAGRRVHKSFVPHVKIRIRTEEGIFALPKPGSIPIGAAGEKVGSLIQELKNAASAVIKNSRRYSELDKLVNEVVGSNERFEGIASELENAGYEILICLDLSAYAQVQGMARESHQRFQPNALVREAPAPMQLSGSDRKFLAALKISFDAEPLGT
jgi:hypothetical protein